MHVRACLCVSSISTYCDCSVERMAWDSYGFRCFVDENCYCLGDYVVFWATYRTEKWEHPFGLRHPLWNLVSGPEWVGQACGTGQWRDTWPGPTGCGPARRRWQRSQCRLPSQHWRKPCHHLSLITQSWGSAGRYLHCVCLLFMCVWV